MTLSNLKECQLFSAIDVKGVGQHDGGGAGHILSEKNLSQNKGEVVDFTTIKHFIAKIAKADPCWGLTVFPPKPAVSVGQLPYHYIKPQKMSVQTRKPYFDPWICMPKLPTMHVFMSDVSVSNIYHTSQYKTIVVNVNEPLMWTFPERDKPEKTK